MTVAIAVLVLLAYSALHTHHYRKRRRHGLSVWASIPGPFGTRISKRF
jgi:hypothetical protein